MFRASELVRSIQASPAICNRFFSLCREHAPLKEPGAVVREWLPVTRTYCLNLARYAAVLAERAELALDSEQATWESALLVPAHLFGEEMSQGNRGLDGIHYRMFTKLEGAFGTLSGPATLSSGYHQSPATRALTDKMRSQLSEPLPGAGCILVVETIAWEIVAAYREILKALETERGPALAGTRGYVDLHLATEPGHSERAQELVGTLAVLPGAREQLHEAVHVISECFGAFWEALADNVFKPGQP